MEKSVIQEMTTMVSHLIMKLNKFGKLTSLLFMKMTKKKNKDNIHQESILMNSMKF